MNGRKKFVSPDGGWGWIIMIAYVANNILIVPMQQSFGLLFKDTFKLLEMSGVNVASIISTNTASAELVGLVTGPLLKHFRMRTVSVLGAISFTIGVTTLTFAKSYIAYMISYGFLTGIGVGLIRLTSRLSLNLYFNKRRGKVIGVAIALRSTGSLIFPYIVVLLLSLYTTPGAVLIIGGICFHTVCVSLLIRPVEWYMKSETHATIQQDMKVSLLDSENEEQVEHAPKGKLQQVIHFYDLSLFKNPRFLSTTFGVTLTAFADLSFSTLFPLILGDLGLSNLEIATFVSTSYISNIIIRFTIPFIGDYFKRSSRFMYCLSCYLVIVGRFVIVFFSKSTASAALPILWGIAKGMRTVYWSVIIADNTPREQMASGESIQSVLNGVACLICGPFLGLIKDVSGTYVSCVHVLNAVTFVSCCLWTVEGIYHLLKKKKTHIWEETLL